jgi:hypothetical protein
MRTSIEEPNRFKIPVG